MDSEFDKLIIRVMWTLSIFTVPWLAYKAGVWIGRAWMKRTGESQRNVGYFLGAATFAIWIGTTAHLGMIK